MGALHKLGGDDSRAVEAFLDLLADRIADRVASRIGTPQINSPKRLLTLKEAGALIGRSSGAVGQLIQRGELLAVRCGRRVHIEQKEIDGWIERCRSAH